MSASTDLYTPSPVKFPDRRPDDHQHQKVTSESRVQLRGDWQSWWKSYRPQVNRFIRQRVQTVIETQHLRDASVTVGSAKRKFAIEEDDNRFTEVKKIRVSDLLVSAV